MPLHLRKGTEADISGMARVLVAAFRGDAITTGIFPPHLRNPDPSVDEETPWRMERMLARMKQPQKVTMVVEDDMLPEENRIVGIAQWDRPSAAMPAELAEEVRQAAQPILTGPKSLDVEALKSLIEAIESANEKLYGKESLKKMWHLHIIAVDPKHQRRGIGKMLLDWGLNEAASQGEDCFLEATPAGRPLYLVAGFEELAEITLLGGQHWQMLKRGSTKGQTEGALVA